MIPIGGRVLRVLFPNGPEEISEDRAKHIAGDQQERAPVAIVQCGLCVFDQLPRCLLGHVVSRRNNGSKRWTWSLDRDPGARGSFSRRSLGRKCIPGERRDPLVHRQRLHEEQLRLCWTMKQLRIQAQQDTYRYPLAIVARPPLSVQVTS